MKVAAGTAEGAAGAGSGIASSLRSMEAASGTARSSVAAVGGSTGSLPLTEESSPLARSSPTTAGSWRQASTCLARWCPCCPCAKGPRRGLTVSVVEEATTPLLNQVPTSLLTAAHFGTEAQAQEFLASASAEDLAEGDSSGRVALHHAARRGFLDLCRAIVEWEEAPRPEEQSPKAPASPASASGRRLVVRANSLRQLVRRMTRPLPDWVNACDGSGATALHAAAAEGRSDVCAWLLQQVRFTEVERQDSCGHTALQRAAAGGHAGACLALLGAQRPGRLKSYWAFAGAAAKDADGRTALHSAAESGSEEACKALCQHKRTAGLVFAADEGGWTPLHCAARAGNVEACRVLLHSAKPVRGLLEAAEAEGRTALHLAAQADKAQACNVLLDCWAEQRLGHGELGTFLRIAYHTIANDPASEAAGRLGANARDRQGRTALHLAARAGAAKACEALLQHPVFDAVAVADNRGRTAADVATGKAKHFMARAVNELRAFQREWC